jgi:hypothetical protein
MQLKDDGGKKRVRVSLQIEGRWSLQLLLLDETGQVWSVERVTQRR